MTAHVFLLFFFQSSFYPPSSRWILESKLVRFCFISSRPKWWSQLLCFAVWQRWVYTFCSTIQSVFGLKGVWVIFSLRYWMQLFWNTECNPKSNSLFFISTKCLSENRQDLLPVTVLKFVVVLMWMVGGFVAFFSPPQVCG